VSVRELLRVHGQPKREVYFDIENSGFVPDEVVEAMLPYFNRRGYGNPAITHKPGWEAYEVFYETKELVAKTINAGPEEIVFTHSGTEANNLALMGFVLASKKKGKIVSSIIEHGSVLFVLEEISKRYGWKYQLVPVDEEGLVDPSIFATFIDRDTLLISIQLVNHEIGTIQDIKALVDVARDRNPDVVFHTDAVDAYGRMEIDVERLGVDMLTISSHKILGPKGVGVLYIKEGVKLEPIMRGQLSAEKLWPGVENIPIIAGFKRAVELAFDDLGSNIEHMRDLRDRLMKGIIDSVPDVIINGPVGDRRVCDNVNVSFLYVEGEAITIELSMRGIYVSSGSACTSRYLEPSHVLLAIGRRHEEAHGSILFKVTRYHTVGDIEYTLEQIPDAIDRLRKISSWKPSR